MKLKLFFVMTVLLTTFIRSDAQCLLMSANILESVFTFNTPKITENLFFDDERTHCVTPSAYWTDNQTCLSVKTTNNCSDSVDVQVCVEGSGGWICGLRTNVTPGNTPTYGFWNCGNPTGRYKWSARRAGSRMTFPKP